MSIRGVGGVMASVAVLLASAAASRAAEPFDVAQGSALSRAERAEPTLEPPDRVDAFLAQTSLQPALEKLGRGGANVLTGWLEVPLNIRRHYNPNSPTTAVTSVLTGSTLGLLKGLLRTGVGVYETVTFLIPLPEHYAPILPPLERVECVKSAFHHLARAACP